MKEIQLITHGAQSGIARWTVSMQVLTVLTLNWPPRWTASAVAGIQKRCGSNTVPNEEAIGLSAHNRANCQQDTARHQRPKTANMVARRYPKTLAFFL